MLSRLFRNFGWLFLAATAILATEWLINQSHSSTPIERSNLLEYRFGHQESPDRLFVLRKAALFERAAPTVVQVGDSSGFHGVQPPVVESILGGRYLNMNVFASQGYKGYLAMARFMLRNNPGTRALVLHITPAGAQPQAKLVSERGLLGADIDDALNGPLTKFTALPSLALRRQITDVVYYGPYGTTDTAMLRMPKDYPGALELIAQSGGWTRERDNRIGMCGAIPGLDGCEDVLEPILAWGRRKLPTLTTDDQIRDKIADDFGESPNLWRWKKLRRENLAFTTYDEFRSLATEHHARLVIVGAPVPDVFDQGPARQKIESFNETLVAYKALHPDVAVVPSPFLPEKKFSSAVHVATPYAREYSESLAHGLLQALGQFAHVPDAREQVSEIVLDENAPVYGFGHTSRTANGPHRSLREGRETGLLFVNLRPSAAFVTLHFAESTPTDLVDRVQITMNDEVLRRVPSAWMSSKVTFEIPLSAWKFERWAELLVSIEGARRWPGDGRSPTARGAELNISRIEFHSNILAPHRAEKQSP